MGTRKASIKETGEELSPQEWERFDAAVAEEKARRKTGSKIQPFERGATAQAPQDAEGPKDGPALDASAPHGIADRDERV